MIKNIETDQFSRDVVEALVLFAKKQGIKTVAEFVHSKEVFEVLKTIGIDEYQGYYFSKPKLIK